MANVDDDELAALTGRGGKKSEKRSLNSLIIHPAIEPGVIDNAMLTRCILEHGPTEEAGRLFAEEGVHLDETTVIRLEFQNILRIDHLWMLKSLTKLTLSHNLIEKIENLDQLPNLNEVDLSFNKIEKIENLDELVNIEVLSLFHNKIRKLENMDTLTKLLVFSIGDNLIEDFKEMAYLRRFRFLRSVSFKGNPCSDDPMAYQFLKSALTKVTYLDYKTITEEDREAGRSLFRGLLRKLDEVDEIAENERIAKEEYDAKVEFYALSFVEYLSGPEMFESMFEKDVDGSLLLKVGGELITFFDIYKEQYVDTMATLVEWAQGAYSDRQYEIKLFKDLINGALAESVEKSKEVLKEFQIKKKPLVDQMNELIAKFTEKKATLEQVEPQIVELGDQFNDVLYDVWKKLMTLEMNLFEQCEESRIQFSVNMADMITKLLEHARNAFGSWREHEAVWSMRQFEALSKLLGNKILLGDVPAELFEVMMDRDQMMNLVAASSDSHMRFIDAREDLLMTRANAWRDHLCDSTNDNEIKRNRDRILEINYFIDNEREDWTDKQMSITDAVDRETAALLGDEY
ncbi:dynein regulatory complex subunit 3-like [Pectinophora gossypiella]|uniref:dynein regulatory complex subunit 3-like n=1 Tax=Pectinophora gossypiella TaxID=13191 RepID=UPI00214E28D8|nr:dynein regulatory complex subunit 3-like [Pectinophora gossypiella]